MLWLIVQLPYPVLCLLGRFLGKLSKPFLKKRMSIAEKNITLCFPEMSADAQRNLINENFTSLGMALIETGMAWFWSDQRVRKWFDIEGRENITSAKGANKGIMVIGVHFMSLELCGRVIGLSSPVMATYRPHNSPLMEWVQTKCRLRSLKSMIDRRNLKGLIGALKSGESVWFAPDQDYGPKGSVFAPFFSVNDAATTNGTNVISRLSNANILTMSMIRKPNKKGYRLYISAPLIDYPAGDEVKAAGYMNKLIEQEIGRAPDQYLWMHRRFKTRPEGMASLY